MPHAITSLLTKVAAAYDSKLAIAGDYSGHLQYWIADSSGGATAPSSRHPPSAPCRSRSPKPARPETPPRPRNLPASPQRPAGMRARIAGLRTGSSRSAVGVVGGDVARRDRVHLHAAPAHSLASALVNCADAALGRRVSRHRDAALEAQQRCGEDDLPRPALQHAAAEFARQDELRVQIDFDDLVPILVGMLGGRLAQDGAGVVDQDIDGRAFGASPVR